MRLLIVTQKVDTNDDILGFFHAWVAEFAKHCERVTVICLEKGEYDLPENVLVLSLGKEKLVTGYWLLVTGVRLRYVIHFYRLIFRERKNYDAVFVHMNQEYVVLGGLFWRLLGKKILLWRNHRKGSMLTRLAVMLSNTVFSTSRFSFAAQYEKTRIVGAGVDTAVFKKYEEISKKENSLLFLGRISPVKNIHDFLAALKILCDKKVSFRASIVGNAVSHGDEEYYKELKDFARRHRLEDSIKFLPGISHKKTPAYYNRCGIYVNLTPSGSLDKTILEAFACESICVISNESFRKEIAPVFFVEQGNAEALAEKIEYMFTLSSEEKKRLGGELRKYAERRHSLTLLSEVIARELAFKYRI